MALTNSGFNGSVTETEWAYMAAIGQADGVESSSAWAVTQGTGRQTSTAAQNGRAFAKGVISKDTAAILTSIGTPTNGQWYLLVRRINWSTDTVTVVALPHTTTSTTVPTAAAAPVTYPTMSVTPGTEYDQPLAWVWVRSTDTTMVLVDLRKLPLGDRLTSLEGQTFANVPDFDALPSATAFEGRRVNVDEGNVMMIAQDGVWVQSGDATFASTAARDTAYAKASAAYRVARASALDTSTGLASQYSGSAWVIQQPADDTGWATATLAGAWVAFGGNHAAPGYRKVGTRVELRGTAKSGALGTLLTLPVGFRPPFDFYVNVMANGGTAQLSVTAATGVVALLAFISPATNAILGLHGVSFYTD